MSELADQIAQKVENAAHEIIEQWDILIKPNGLSLHQDLVNKANLNETIYPKDVLFIEELEVLSKKHMGVYYDQFGWCVASAVYNVAAGLPMRGNK